MNKLNKFHLIVLILLTVAGGAAFTIGNHSAAHTSYIATDVDLPPCH